MTAAWWGLGVFAAVFSFGILAYQLVAFYGFGNRLRSGKMETDGDPWFKHACFVVGVLGLLSGLWSARQSLRKAAKRTWD
jgi:hypothetical protein